MRTLTDVAARYAPLTAEAITAGLRELPAWRCDGSRLVRTVVARDVWALLEQVVAVEDELDHHAEVTLDRGCVTFTLWTHARDAITATDLELAQRLDHVIGSLGLRPAP